MQGCSPGGRGGGGGHVWVSQHLCGLGLLRLLPSARVLQGHGEGFWAQQQPLCWQVGASVLITARQREQRWQLLPVPCHQQVPCTCVLTGVQQPLPRLEGGQHAPAHPVQVIPPGFQQQPPAKALVSLPICCWAELFNFMCW